MDQIERLALFLYFITYFTTAFAWRSWCVWRRSGINPYVLLADDSAQGYVGQAFRKILLAVGIYSAVQALWPGVDERLGKIDWLAIDFLQSVGWAMLIVSLIGTGIAQAQMNLSWRIGIDFRHDTELVQSGLFARSRNPIFLAMRVSLAGLVLTRPNAFTLAAALAGELLMQLQVREEEAFLRRRHGDAYLEYCARTSRWL